MKHVLRIAAALAVLAGCAPRHGENVYSAHEVGIAKPVERCRVLAVRQIEIRDPQAAHIGQSVGTITGAVAGGVLGNEIGAGSGRFAASALGSIAGGLLGGLIGNEIGNDVGRRAGLEYAILLQGGEEITFAQEILPGDRVIRAGETCRVQVDPHGYNRILPVTGLPRQVPQPQATTFY